MQIVSCLSATCIVQLGCFFSLFLLPLFDDLLRQLVVAMF